MIRFLTPKLALAASIILATACSAQSIEHASTAAANDDSDKAVEVSQAGMRSGKVVETIDAANYTYVQVDTGTERFWAAAPRCEIEVGQQVTVPTGMPMENFHSETLDRDFELIFFVQGFGLPGQAHPPGQLQASHSDVGTAGASPSVDLSGISVPENGITISSLYASKKELAGKSVLVRGKVVKVNLSIMGRNWLHVQDGSGSSETGTHDLTVTTSDVAALGDLVTISGNVTLDKDFGAGYRYPLIVEDASITIE